VHGHLFHKNHASDKFYEIYAKLIAKQMNLSIEQVRERVIPMLWACDINAHVEAMDEAGIDKAVVMAVDWGMNEDVGEAPWSIEEINKQVYEQVKEYPDKIHALCAVDPRRGEKAIQLVEKAVQEWDMKGVKFHPTAGYYPDDPAFYPLYEKCVELDIPLCSHTAATINAPFMSKFANPIYLDTVAAKFPDLKILMIHFGSLSYTMNCVEIMACRPNVHTEFSGYQAHATTMPDYFLKTLRYILDAPTLIGPPIREKLMFGTDWPYLETIMDQKTWVEWFNNIPQLAETLNIKFKQREIKYILAKNAEKFFNLK